MGGFEAKERSIFGDLGLKEEISDSLGDNEEIRKSADTLQAMKRIPNTKQEEINMSTGSTSTPLSTWSKVVEAINAETFFAQLEDETAGEYVARINKARDILVKHLTIVKDAATEMNKGIKAGREIHPAIFNKINPSREFRTVKDKPNSFNNLKF